MKVCIPIEEDKGLESVPYGHFGSAPMFMIADSETEETKVLENAHEHTGHGGPCNPLRYFSGEEVNALLVAGIGARAIMRLNELDIKVYRAIPGTVKDNLVALKKDDLDEFAADSACARRGGGGRHS